jgi:hypothetical protein
MATRAATPAVVVRTQDIFAGQTGALRVRLGSGDPDGDQDAQYD